MTGIKETGKSDIKSNKDVVNGLLNTDVPDNPVPEVVGSCDNVS